ncbi:MAG: SO_0444 family Cu/Zn efflux transporter [Clostridia bacterium]|nr:SO_0444 family Cu/Zn efflux transporter [Clostridia bacterium]
MIGNFLLQLFHLFTSMAPYLLLGLIFVGILHAFINENFIKKHIGQNNLGSIIKASLIGVPLPLCSCGVVPTAVELRKNGASKGAVISFLISTPQTGLDSMVATYGMMGLAFAIYRPLAAFVSGILGGAIISFFMKKQPDILKETASVSCHGDCCHHEEEKKHLTFNQKIRKMVSYSFGEFLDDISLHFLIGLLIATLITVLIPDDFFISLHLDKGLLSMLMMIVIGLPMYVCSTSSIPIAISLLIKGISPGAAFVFLFAGPVTNIASITVLGKTLGKKMTVFYVSVVSLLAILSGYILDFVFTSFNLNLQFMAAINGVSGEEKSIFTLIVSFLFLILLLRSLLIIGLKKIRKTKNKLNQPMGEQI